MQQGASIGGVAGAEGEKPPSQARKGHNQNHLQRHDGVVSRLDGRQIQLERQGQQNTQTRRNSQYWKAADGEAQGQRQRQPPGRDALPQPGRRLALHRGCGSCRHSSTLSRQWQNLVISRRNFGKPRPSERQKAKCSRRFLFFLLFFRRFFWRRPGQRGNLRREPPEQPGQALLHPPAGLLDLLVAQGVALSPAARLVTQLMPSTSIPMWRATIVSGTVDMPTSVAPSARKARISAGVSKLGPLTAR